MTRALVRIGEFLRMESAAGIILIFAAAFALIASNSPFAVEYAGLFQQYLQVGFGEQAINKPILLWINDALMAIGFKGGVEMGAGASWGGGECCAGGHCPVSLSAADLIYGAESNHPAGPG